MLCRVGPSRWIVLVLVAGALAGCPVPIPRHYDATSRQNLGPEIQAALVPGVTTRAEVMLLLGEPDGAADDESWLAYGSIYSKGGVVFVLFAGSSGAGAGSEKIEYRRLVVTFDAQGVLREANFVSQDCWEAIAGFGSAGGRSEPCLEIASPDGEHTDPQVDPHERAN